jgi:scyllo-inositol 2-dehydrogenase (NADP+)
MNAKKHVVTDKIMCMTVAEADRMIAAAKRNKVFLSVFHNRRWDGDFLTIKKVIDDGLLGKVFQIESCVGSYGAPRRGWRGFKELAGGHLYDWGAHMVDHALLFAGGAAKAKPEWVYATSEHRKWEITVESHVRAEIKFRGSFRFLIEVSRLVRLPKPRWFVLGEEGTLVKEGLEPQERFMIAGNIEAAKDEPQNYPRVKTELNGVETQMTIEALRGNWKAYYQNVADVLLKGAKPAVRPEEAREVVRLVTAAMRSVETGKVVRL